MYTDEYLTLEPVQPKSEPSEKPEETELEKLAENEFEKPAENESKLIPKHWALLNAKKKKELADKKLGQGKSQGNKKKGKKVKGKKKGEGKKGGQTAYALWEKHQHWVAYTAEKKKCEDEDNCSIKDMKARISKAGCEASAECRRMHDNHELPPHVQYKPVQVTRAKSKTQG